MNSPRAKKAANRPSLALFALTRACESLGVVVLFSMMILTGADVVARYLFNRPISGAFELVEIMLAVLVFLALPASIRFDSHIRVELIHSFGSSLTNRIVKLAVALVGTIIFVVLTFELYTHAEKLRSYGQVTNSLEIPLYLVGFLASGCCLISVFLLLREVILSTGDRP